MFHCGFLVDEVLFIFLVHVNRDVSIVKVKTKRDKILSAYYSMSV